MTNYLITYSAIGTIAAIYFFNTREIIKDQSLSARAAVSAILGAIWPLAIAATIYDVFTKD
ncbi:MAG: hypothetical protein F6K24_03545 [Okeania sp. SIO2D1]|nr:hypothetical protein [Okeania sp. SIO2D1]